MRSTSLWTLLALLAMTQGCAKQASFDSAGSAVDALVVAMRAGDSDQFKRLLGPEGDEIVASGDPVADKQMRDTFLKAYDEKHQLVEEKDGSITIIVGKADWPLPIPVVKHGDKWRFDTEAGKEEILNRRIGRNELTAIQTCLAILDAQGEYAAGDPDGNGLRDYATKFISDAGKKNGLFWPTEAGETPSPLGPMVAVAAGEGYGGRDPADTSRRAYHGYYFRILTSQGEHAAGGTMDYTANGKLIGGFAIVAWPAEYDNSGIMTFIMNHEGVVYQQDLGDDTAALAEAMPAFDPASGWKKVESDK